MTTPRAAVAVPLTAVVLIAALAVAGPWLAPHAPTAPVGVPFGPPGAGIWLGTDHLGRDVLSRVLHGGRPILLTSAVATVLGTVIGGALGLTAALVAGRSRALDAAVTRPLDALASVPPLLLMLVVVAVSPDRVGMVTGVVLAGAPYTARVVRAAALDAAGRAHVEVAVARGERLPWLLGRELAPLVAGTVLADAGLRAVGTISLIGAAGFLGITLSGDDWGALIAEALPAAALQPAALLAPVLLIAVLAVALNVLADEGLHRSRAVLA